MARARRSRPPEAQGAVGGPDPLEFPAAVRIRAPRCRPVVRNVNEGLLLIDNELPAELRRLPRWTFARALLEAALRTRRKRDLAAAARQLRQALSNEGWLDETRPAGNARQQG
ncbi:MAG TPA: hypothetical protein VII40_11155 [Xanthobacteraceae bacterium]